MELTTADAAGFRLEGRNAAWTLERDRIVVEYADSPGVPGLLRRIGSRTVPVDALAGARLATGEGAPVLALQLRAGADPYLDVAAGQLAEEHQLYRLELDRGQEDLAGHHARTLQLHAELNPDSDRPCPGYLTGAADPPLRLRGYDGEAHLEADRVRFRWNSAASDAKLRAGDSVFGFDELDGVEWVKPGVLSGHLAVRRPDAAGGDPTDDPGALLFGLGVGSTSESLVFAAALSARTRAVATPPAGALAGALAPDRIGYAIRVLDGLVADGLLGHSEFERRRTELLDRL